MLDGGAACQRRLSSDMYLRRNPNMAATAYEFDRKIRSAGARGTDYNPHMHARHHPPAAHAGSHQDIAERVAAIDGGIASRLAAIDDIADRVAAIDDDA